MCVPGPPSDGAPPVHQAQGGGGAQLPGVPHGGGHQRLHADLGVFLSFQVSHNFVK